MKKKQSGLISVYTSGAFIRKDFSSAVSVFGNSSIFLNPERFAPGADIAVLPAFCDVHVHFREPGFSYKEDIASGCAAAARGGYTDVCTMPNLDPVPDSVEAIKKQLDIIGKSAKIGVHPYASITKKEAGSEIVDMEELAPYCIAFSDDGRGVQSEDMMRQAMIRAKSAGKMIVAHCEDDRLRGDGYIHDGDYCRAHGHRGIVGESEWRQIERDIRLAAETECSYHVCHISTAESVRLIREAKACGIDISCETAPHYLVLNDSMLEEDGRFNMNPPIRSEADRAALIEGIADGTIDMIATDHAPHAASEKSGGLEKSLMGVVGLETAFPVLYTELVKKNIITIEKLIGLMSVAPRRRFGLPERGDLCVFDLGAEYTVDPAEFAGKGRSTPFEGRRVFGKNLLTVCGGKIVWQA